MATQTYNTETVRISKELKAKLVEKKKAFEVDKKCDISLTAFLGRVVRKGLEKE